MTENHRMAGHSHWAGIKHKKAVVDAKRGKVFSKLAKQITVCAHHGGGDPDMNLSLKYAIDRAKAANMPKDNIARAVKKGTGELGGNAYAEIVYEGYGPGGVAIMVKVLTDNRNRSGGEVRKLFEKYGGSIGKNGCVSWQFEAKAFFTVSTTDYEEEQVFEAALEGGAEDVENVGETFEVTGPVELRPVLGAWISGRLLAPPEQADADFTEVQARLRWSSSTALSLGAAGSNALNVKTKADTNGEERTLFWQHEINAAVRQGDSKLVTANDRDDGAWELYNLAVDRSETENLIAKHPDIAALLKKAWREWEEKSNVLPFPEDRPPVKRNPWPPPPWRKGT